MSSLDAVTSSKITLGCYYESLVDPKKDLREKIADECGVSMATVYRWLSGENSPSKLQREKLAEIIGVKPEDIVFQAEEEASL